MSSEETPFSHISVGKVIDHTIRISVVEKIAEGGMGEVYEALLLGPYGFEKRVALKVVRPRHLSTYTFSVDDRTKTNHSFIQRLIDEAKLVSSLVHTHIVQTYFFGAIDREDKLRDGFIVMEFVQGVNLLAFLDRHRAEGRRVPEELGVYIVSRLARALEYAHNQYDRNGNRLHLVHRDVSPQNVMISIDGVVKLSDFGIATVVMGGAADSAYIVGKQRYMSPEQKAGTPVDFRADQFSLGLILYELLTCKPPEGPRTPKEIPGASAKIGAIYSKTVQDNPSDRYKSSGELATELELAIYAQGYGPTFSTLEEYFRDVFPSLNAPLMPVNHEEQTMIVRKSSSLPKDGAPSS